MENIAAEEYVFRAGFKKSVFVLLGSVGFILVAIFLHFFSDTSRFMILFCGGFFGLLFLIGLYLLIFRPVIFKLNNEGLIIPSGQEKYLCLGVT